MIFKVRNTLIHGGMMAGLLVGACGPALAQPARRGPPEPGGMRVMSDTREWCAHLAAEVATVQQTLPGPHPDADKLAHEGRRLCGTGHVRLGLSRLRYALIELREH